MELSVECVGEANKSQLYKLCEIRCRIDDNSSFIISLEIVFFFLLRLNRDGNIGVVSLFLSPVCVRIYVLYIRNCVSLNKYRIRSRKKNQLKV